MGRDWYDMVASKQGGYVKAWASTKIGISGEDVFEQQLRALIRTTYDVLDAGCGHGDFTLQMAPLAHSIVGIDFSVEMVRAANQQLLKYFVENAQFIHATARELPFENDTFDLIYDRRGPTSILYEQRILKPGGRIIGIHSGAMETIRDRLWENGFENIQMQEYTAIECFPTIEDFAHYLMRMPGETRDFLAREHRDTLRQFVSEHTTVDHGLSREEWRVIWQAMKPECPGCSVITEPANR